VRGGGEVTRGGRGEEEARRGEVRGRGRGRVGDFGVVLIIPILPPPSSVTSAGSLSDLLHF
jgi:hypothetical protein